MMPDLPNVDLERDIEQFIEFFENPAFRPDGLKLYPTLVIRGTGDGYPSHTIFLDSKSLVSPYTVLLVGFG